MCYSMRVETAAATMRAHTHKKHTVPTKKDELTTGIEPASFGFEDQRATTAPREQAACLFRARLQVHRVTLGK